PAGGGPARRRGAGVAVRKARGPAAVRELLRPYRAHLGRRRPWVIAKWAMTLDGRIATRSGDSGWVSSEESRRWAHRILRGRVDAIVVGAGTVRSDDPRLTNRSGRGGQPLRVVVCGRRPLPSRARLLCDGGATLLAAPARFRAPPGAEVLRAGRAGRVDLRRLLGSLYRRGLRRVLVEGGGELLGSLFDRDLVDQVAVFVAPRIVGGTGAVPAVGGRGRRRMRDAPQLCGAVSRRLGGDRVVEGLVEAGGG
ncbi:MAG: RibD family protein, partial [Planctomycetota bacterium]